jgi:putative transposase
LKTLYDLDEFDTTNPAVVEILLYAAVLTLLVSRELLELVIKHADDDAVFPPERWAATFRSHAQQILKRLLRLLATTAVRPDGSRRTEDPSRAVRYRCSTNCWS